MAKNIDRLGDKEKETPGEHGLTGLLYSMEEEEPMDMYASTESRCYDDSVDSGIQRRSSSAARILAWR